MSIHKLQQGDPLSKEALTAVAVHDRRVFENNELQKQSAHVFERRTSQADYISASASQLQLSRLRPLPMREMRLGRRQLWRYVQGRICTPGFKMASVMLVLESEEEEGTACKLAIYNMLPPSAGPAEVDRLFPVGARLVVKEPHYKRYLDGTLGLRVDNPSDIVFLPPASLGHGAQVKGTKGGTIPTTASRQATGSGGEAGSTQREPEASAAAADGTGSTAEDLQELSRRANQMYREGDYVGALSCYERCLEAAPGNAALHSNCAIAHLALAQWEQAYLAARRALDLEPAHPKARYRLARAMLYLRCYEPALEHLRLLAQEVPCDKAVLKLQPAAEALAAQAQGQFSPATLLEGKADAGRGKAPAPVLADWVGPVEVFPSPTAGRGPRATRALRAGELLLVERSLVTAQARTGLPFHLDFTNGRMNTPSQQQLAGDLLHCAAASALDRQRVLSLYSGDAPSRGAGSEGAGREGAGAAGLAAPAALQAFHSEGELRAALEAAMADAAQRGGEPDLQRTLAVVQLNAWGGQGGKHDPALPPGSALEGEHSSVWALLCAANHSCAPNAHVLFVAAAGPSPGDAASYCTASLRASRDIPAGEEISVAYNEDVVWQPLRQRREKLRSWGFTCRCGRCMGEEALPRSVQSEAGAIAEALGSESSPGPWRLRYRQLSSLPLSLGELGAHRLRSEVQRKLEQYEGALQAAVAALQPGAAGEDSEELLLHRVHLGLASVLQAYRLLIASAQMGHDLPRVLQLQRKCLRIIAAVRPGGMEHAIMAAIHAADAGQGMYVTACTWREIAALASQTWRGLPPPTKEALALGAEAAKIRYGRELSDAEALRLLDRILRRSMRA